MDYSAPAVEATRRRLVARFGSLVGPWWNDLAGLISALEDRWGIDVAEPVGRGNTSLVLRCRDRRGVAAIVKLTPDPEVARLEAMALGHWQSTNRVPVLLDQDVASGALLLEAIGNEIPIADVAGNVSLNDVVELIRALHEEPARTYDQCVPRLEERIQFIFDHWIRRHGNNPVVVDVVPAVRLERDREAALALAAADGSRLLHGDLHPGNVIDATSPRGLVAIDPRPCIGDPAFDVVDWVFWQANNVDAWRARTRDLAAALSLDEGRLSSWCIACAGLLAAGAAARGGPSDRVRELLSLGASG